jgi:hypothetical protein
MTVAGISNEISSYSLFTGNCPLLFVLQPLLLFADRCCFRIMFDVSWTDPSRETVGQRKSRKDQETNGLSRESSIRSSRSSDSTPPQTRPSLFNILNGSKKETLHRSGSHSKSRSKTSSFRSDHPSKSATRLSSSAAKSHPSNQESPEEPATTTTATRIPVNGFFSRGSSYNTDAEQSSSSEGRRGLHYQLCIANISVRRRICLFRMDRALSCDRVFMGLGGGFDRRKRPNCATTEPEFICDSTYGGHYFSSRECESLRASSYSCTHILSRNNATPRSRITYERVSDQRPEDEQFLTCQMP